MKRTQLGILFIFIFSGNMFAIPMNSITFPQDLTGFLHWIKETTEAYWSHLPAAEPMHNAKWLPLTDGQIDALERKYAISFDVEHRAFLKVLHTIDKNEEEEMVGEVEYVETEEEKANREFWSPPYRPSYFYNWITDHEWIVSRLAWIEDFFIDGILGVNGSWLKSWGERPDSREEKIRIFKEWYSKAPCLLPITAHTFLMADGGYGLKPLLSVYGFDTIVKGWSLRHYLLTEFKTALGLSEVHYDYDEEADITDLKRGIPEIDALQTIKLNDAVIPYWKEVINYYSHPDKECWQGLWVPMEKPTNGEKII